MARKRRATSDALEILRRRYYEGRPTSTHFVMAVEANGNLTLYHRQSGEVILFAPDHDFEHVTPLGQSPEYTLYRIDGVPTFSDWVESIAKQWARYVE